MRSGIVHVLLLSSMTLGACAPGAVSAASAPAASRTQVMASTPRTAVLRLIQPFASRSAGSARCNAVEGKLAACPITARLRSAVANELQWERRNARGGAGNEFCRCQNPPQRITVTRVTTPYTTVVGRFAEVDTVWYWGGHAAVRLNWIAQKVTLRNGSGWQVDDGYCASHPKRDLYHIPVGPCPAT